MIWYYTKLRFLLSGQDFDWDLVFYILSNGNSFKYHSSQRMRQRTSSQTSEVNTEDNCYVIQEPHFKTFSFLPNLYYLYSWKLTDRALPKISSEVSLSFDRQECGCCAQILHKEECHTTNLGLALWLRVRNSNSQGTKHRISMALLFWSSKVFTD